MDRSVSAQIVALLMTVGMPALVMAQPKGADDRIVELLKSEGHRVERDESRPGKPVVAVGFTIAPSEKGIKELGKLKSLKRVSLTPTQIGADGIAEVAKLSNLEVLEFGGIGLGTIKDEHVKALAGLKQLRELNLKNNLNFGDEGLKWVAKLPAIESLGLSLTGVTDAGTEELLALQKLKKLDLSVTRVGDKTIGRIAQIKTLRSLNIESVSASADAMKQLSELRDLEELHMNIPSSGSGFLAELGKLTNLRVLNVFTQEISDDESASLGSLTRLEDICIRVKEFSPKALGAMKDLPGVKKLRLAWAIDEHLKVVGKWTKLETLDLDNTKVTDAGIAELKGCKNLKSLVLTDTKVTGIGLGDFKSLESLYLYRTPVTDKGLKGIGSLTKLQYLNLGDTAVSPALAGELRNLKALRELNLFYTDFDEKDEKDLKKALPKCQVRATKRRP